MGSNRQVTQRISVLISNTSSLEPAPTPPGRGYDAMAEGCILSMLM